jgi:hypothetical protein
MVVQFEFAGGADIGICVPSLALRPQDLLSTANPVRFLGFAGGSINWRMASNNAVICSSWASTRLSNSASLPASSLCAPTISLSVTKARTIRRQQAGWQKLKLETGQQAG